MRISITLPTAFLARNKSKAKHHRKTPQKKGENHVQVFIYFVRAAARRDGKKKTAAKCDSRKLDCFEDDWMD